MKNLICLLLLLGFVSIAYGSNSPISISSCHCFKDRVYNPQKKFAADQYLLATSFNSFLAANFHLSKSQIVMMKMKGGVAPDDLLLGLYLSRAGGVELNSVLAVLANGGSWQQILDSENFKEKQADTEFFAILRAALPTEGLAGELVTDQLLKEFFKVSENDIEVLRKAGAGSREMVLLYILERYAKPGMKAVAIWAMYDAGKRSWAEIVNGFGLSPKATGKLLSDQG